mmetsp:Transcript_12573/g.27145  ORF Transcript_12573/g.27145 Transcript_12573/m.27145 type:complete len:186 (-) Transcript_12573:543-1100(-)
MLAPELGKNCRRCYERYTQLLPLRRRATVQGAANRRTDGANNIGSKSLQTTSKYNTGNLAFLGDSIWTLYIRGRCLLPPKHITLYHAAADPHVTAERQALYYDQLIAKGLLMAPELQLMQAARTSQSLHFRSRFKDNRQKEQYRKSTAVEALVGYLYMTDQARLQEVMGYVFELMDAVDSAAKGP